MPEDNQEVSAPVSNEDSESKCGALYRVIKSFLLKFTLSYYSILYYVWLWIVSMAFVYNLIFIPLRASFTDFNDDNLAMFFAFDYAIADVVYIVDMFIRARTTFYRQGIAVTDTRLLWLHYFRTWNFVLDVISIIPTDLLYLAIGTVYTIVRLNRLFKYSRLFEMTSRVETTAAFPNVFRMATTTFGILLAIHFIAVLYYSYSKWVGFGLTNSTKILDPQNDDMVRGTFQLELWRAQQPFISRYTYCFYWSTMTLCFIGEMPHGKSPHEQLIQAVIWLLGLMMFAAIVGRTGLILNNVGIETSRFQRKAHRVRVYLDLQKVSKDLYKKVILWFQYAFDNRALGGEEKVLRPLPDKLQSEIAADMHFATLRKVKLFEDVDDSVLIDLVTSFHLQTFSPGDFVCRKGDIGREMYIVKRGSLQVVSDDGSKIFVTLGPGSVFGEISLLNIPGSRTGNRRTANVRSKGYSDVFSLSKADLYASFQYYPEAMRKMTERGTEILRNENKIDEEAVFAKQEAEENMKMRLVAIENAVEETETRLARLIAEIGVSRKHASTRIGHLERLLKFPLFTEGENEDEEEEEEEEEENEEDEEEEEEEGGNKEEKKRLEQLAKPDDVRKTSSAVLVEGLGELPTVKIHRASPTASPIDQ